MVFRKSTAPVLVAFGAMDTPVASCVAVKFGKKIQYVLGTWHNINFVVFRLSQMVSYKMLKLNLVRCWNWIKCYAFPQTGARPFPNTVVLTHCPLADAWKSVKFHFKRQSLPSYLLHCLWNCTGMLTYNLESTLVQVMACCHQATSHYLRQSWHRSMSPYGITRPQWEMQVTIGLCSGLVLKRQQIINWTNDGPARWWPDSSPFIYKDAVLLVKEFLLTIVLSSLWEALYSIRYCALICANNIQNSLDTEGKILQVWYFSFFVDNIFSL